MAKQLNIQPGGYDLTKAEDLMALADVVKQFIVDNKLFASLQGKNYPLIEAWQFAGALVGIHAVTVETRNESTAGNTPEVRYWARVELQRTSDGAIVGAGESVCSTKEKGRAKNEDYVVISMAQTRATGKAYRLKIGWLLKLAGYEGVSAEEMAETTTDTYQAAAELPIDDVRTLVDMRLSIMTATEKARFVKDYTGRMNIADLSDVQWRSLYANLPKTN